MLVGTVEVTLLVLLSVILAGPLIAERFRIPGMLGLIFFGMLFGPFMLGWLGRLGLVSDLGSIGILYLMFLAGLSFNLKVFIENRRSAITLGLLGFGLPFLLSLWIGLDWLELEFIAAALIGAMWASNTLVAYPDVRAAGLAENRGVRDAVSAGVVADLLSLLVLAIATSAAVIDISDLPEGAASNSERTPGLPLWITVPMLVGFTIYVLPKIGRWFFVRVGHSRVQRFLFALVGMAAGASLAVAAGIEGLIGAFLAGLGLNALIPKNSELMDRLDFVGSTVFVPAFLVSIGLAIDPAVLFDAKTLTLGVLFTGLVVIGKSIAVTLSGVIFKLSSNEIGLMATLSFGQAASTLAIAQVGFELGLFGQDIVNGAVIAIVFTALATSYGTRFFIRRVPRPLPPPTSIGERVLVDARPLGSNVETVFEFAGRIALNDGGVVIPFGVPPPGHLENGKLQVQEAERAAAVAGHDATGVVRVSETFTTGALELVEESEASLAILTWTGLRVGRDNVFGSEIDAFGVRSPIPTVAAQLINPWKRVVLVVGNTGVAWHREDAALAVDVASRLRSSRDAAMLVFAPREGDPLIADLDPEVIEVKAGPLRARELVDLVSLDDLVIFPAYVLRDVSLTDQLRIARSFAQIDVAIVAGPNRLTVARSDAPHRMERLVGHGL